MNAPFARNPVVGISDVSVGYEGAAAVIEGVSFEVSPGSLTVLIGPSGAGKSSLLQVIAGLLKPRRGHVRIGNEASPVADGRPGRMVGFVFQDALLFPWRSVRQNVELGLEGLGLSRQDRRRRGEAVLDLVGLAEHAGKWPHQLSGGQRQRVGLARALAVEPKLLLMDEPFAALDPRNREALQDELLKILARTGIAILFVTHDMREAVYLADRILVLGDTPARIVADIAVDEPRPRSRRAQQGLVAELHKTFNLAKSPNEEDE